MSHRGATAQTKRNRLELLLFIARTIWASGISPTYDEMSAHLGLKSKTSVLRLVEDLETDGYIRRIPLHARAIELVSNTFVRTQLHGFGYGYAPPRSTYDQLLALVKASTVPAPETLKRVFLVGLKHIQPVAAKRAGHSSSSGRVGIHAAAGGSIPRGAKP